MSLLQTNPTREALLCSIARANSNANPSRARTRLCSLPNSIAAEILSSPEGVEEEDGGAVANSYKYGCETSYVIAAWWTDGAGRRHVRIDGRRTDCRHASHGNGNGTSRAGRAGAWTAVFPERATKLAQAHRARCRAAIARLGIDPGEVWHAEFQRLEREMWTARQSGGVASPEYIAVESALAAHRAAQPTDTARTISGAVLLAASPEGLLIGDRRERPTTVQLVVTDSTTGHRHQITVPPKFGRPESKTWQRLGNDAARVHAALAWTFALEPAQYAPQVTA
jgi:hypothetical protein